MTYVLKDAIVISSTQGRRLKNSKLEKMAISAALPLEAAHPGPISCSPL